MSKMPQASFVARMQGLDDVDRAAVELATLELDLVGDLDAVRRLIGGLLADAGVEGHVGAHGRSRRGCGGKERYPR